MDIQERLKTRREERQKVIDEINELTNEEQQIAGKKQLLLQQALRLDGKVTELEELVKE